MTDPLEISLKEQAQQDRPIFWFRLRCGLVEELLPEGPITLTDIGAGTGVLGDYLRRVRPDVSYCFIEPIPALAESLSARFGANSNHRDLSNLSPSTVVTLMDVLEHQANDRGFLSDICDSLNPDAILIVTVPALPLLWSRWDTEIGHFRRYTKRSLLDTTEGLPLKPLEVTYLFPEMLPGALFRKWKLRASSEKSISSEDAGRLPRVNPHLDEVAYRIGRLTLRHRARWPLGTSVLGVFRKV